MVTPGNRTQNLPHRRLRFSFDLEKWFRLVFVICFIGQWMKRSKHGLFVFPPKKTLIWRRHCSAGQSCCSRVFISRLYKNRSKTNLITATCYLPIIHLSLYLHLSPSQHQADITQPETKLLVSQYACATLKKMSEINKGTEGRQWTAGKKRKKTRFNCSCNSAVGLSRLCS